ncbi:cation efflux transporter [Zymomonas mobilis subsp. pomaceae ATCC 29192]|uniref:Cation efflux transporter n=2 Tax=Zymomonas mobilis TaxID=542 RepID=F8EVG9_ZYMMT|nr:cation efflux transporter [Zymomonas mobilis subsp. pomaceae ATCC 29192]
MLALVRIALRRPYTFIVMAVMILIVGVLSAFKTPTDIFPDIKIPIVAVIWQFQGMSPDDIQSRINTPYQRSMTTVVNNIDHLEAMAIANFGIVKIFFQPGTDIRLANAQITASAQTVLRSLPRGINPPLILNYSASTVPILQLSVHGKGLTEQQLNDLSFNAVRAGLITVPGSAIPYPWGGRVRQIQFDVDPHALQSKGLTAEDVSNTIAQQTQITPAGFAKIGPYQYNVRLNNVPGSTEQLNHLPIKTINGATVYISDVAHVRDGSAPQTNVVHVDGARSVLLTVYKNGSASTVSVAAGILAKIPSLLVGLPSSLRVEALTNQAIFVK